MTEKRFYLNKKGNIIDVISDTELRYIENMQVVVDLLNELNDENEQLKHDATVLISANRDYRKKNEEFKKVMDTMLKQIKTEIIKDDDVIYSATIHFDKKQFDIIRKIWKGDYLNE